LTNKCILDPDSFDKSNNIQT